MKELNELLHFVTCEMKGRHGIIEELMTSKKDQKLNLMLKGLRRQQLGSDEDAIKILYGEMQDTVKYRVLKTRFKDKLINFIFLCDHNYSLKNSYNRSLFSVYRNLLAAQMLILKDKRKIAISLLKPTLQTALLHQHTPAVIAVCRLLCYHAAYNSNTKDLDYYNSILEKQQRLLVKEVEIESLYNSILSRTIRTADADRNVTRLLENNFDKAKKIYKSRSSYHIALYYHRIAMRYYHSRHRFADVIKICRQFSEFLAKNPGMYQAVRAGEFALYEMESCMRLQHFDEGRKCAQRCMQFFSPYSTPWMQFQEYYYLLAMRTGKTTDALQILNMVTGSSKFKKLTAIQKERWQLHEAYLNFALPDELPKKQFNLFRFSNEVTQLNFDKTGYSFSILLAQIILLINIGNISRLTDIENSLKMYMQRHIKKDKNPRHFYFGCMLRLLFRNNFKAQSISGKTKPYFQKLKQTKNKFHELEETEVIPYEKLWLMLEEKCTAQFGRDKNQVKKSLKENVKIGKPKKEMSY